MSKPPFTREWPSDLDALAKDQEQFKSKVYYPQIRQFLADIKAIFRRQEAMLRKQKMRDKREERMVRRVQKLEAALSKISTRLDEHEISGRHIIPMRPLYAHEAELCQ